MSAVIHMNKARARRNGYRMFISVYILLCRINFIFYSFSRGNLVIIIFPPVKIELHCERSIYQSTKRRQLNAICFDVRYMYLALDQKQILG